MSCIDSLTENEVLQDVLGVSVPSTAMAAGDVTLRVEYKGKGDVECGADLPPSAAKAQPRVYASGLRAGAKYTLIMSDPDAPSRAAPRCREWLHWIIVNASKTASEGAEETEISGQGYTVCDYNGPTPPRGTGKHRYVFVLYEQGSGDLPEAVSDKRPSFNSSKYAKRKHLNPVAATFFFAENK